MSKQLEFHEIANLFPMYNAEEMTGLEDDIAAHGLKQPIILYKGKILDGRNRYVACQKVGVDCRFEDFCDVRPEIEALEYVWSLNFSRRHLDSQQKAALLEKRCRYESGMQIVVQKIQNEAKERQKEAGKTGGQPSHKDKSSTLVKKFTKVEEPKKQDNSKRTDVQLAKAVGTNHQYLNKAKKLSSEDLDLVIKGEISLDKKPKTLHNTGYEEWYTPLEILDKVREVFDGEIDLDPASCAAANQYVKAKKYFTQEQDGLKQSWHGNIWLNPPFAAVKIKAFAAKLIEELESRNVCQAIWICHNNSETRWFQALIKVCNCLHFPSKRTHYISTKTISDSASPLQGSAIFYFGKDNTKFVKAFSDMGAILRKV